MKDYSQFLKKQFSETQNKNTWSIANLEAGFEEFYRLNGYYPSSPELDSFEYLPSSRQIQRLFGGLQKVRKEMNLEHEILNHNEGRIRSKIAGDAMIRSQKYEEEYYKYLIKHIPELYVHEHKVIRFNGRKTDTDFFIYLPNSNNGIVIDVFYAMDILNLLKQVAIKQPKYKPMPYKTYFISVNENISQENIESRIGNKKSQLSDNIIVCNINYFNSNILPNIKAIFS